MSKPLVAIVGRPNVGKSTLFNRIIGARRAIVHDTPGVTRDRHYAETDWGGRAFILIDTGGYVPDSEDVFEKAVREQVAVSIEEASVVLFLVDGREGVHPLDREIARMLRRSGRPVVLAVNKIDSEHHEIETAQFHELGLGEPFPVSALSGRRSGDLLDRIAEGFPPMETEEPTERIRLAVVGRPNVGKSSVVNAMLGTERSIVTEIPGTTRDALDSFLTHGGRDIMLIDTAGLRRRSKIKESVEFFSTIRTVKSLEQCDVALCLIDATQGLTHQDIDVVSQAVDRSCGVVIGVNKWDLLEKDDRTARHVERVITERLPTYDFIPIVTLSARTRQRVTKTLDLCIAVYDERRKRIPTSTLNERVLEILRNTPPPSTPTGRDVNIFYATQAREAPPVFVFFTNEPKYIPESYRRFVERALRDSFGFSGVPLAIRFRKKS